MHHAIMHRGGIKILLIFVLLLLIFGLLIYRRASAPSLPDSSGQAQAFNKQSYSHSAAGSLWVVVNKQHPLDPTTYVPPLTVPDVKLKGSASAQNMQVSTQMAGALQALFSAAETAGTPLMLSSGYRSYSYQVTVYNTEVKNNGQKGADEQSARPGYSEHQTGLAADVAPASGTCDLSQCFGSTPAGQWLAAHAYQYGFIIRYPADKVAITGYEYEPWHIRYVGVALSTQMHAQGVETLEEFFGVSGGVNY